MYNELKIASLKKTKKGSFATSANVLEDLAFKGNKFPKLVLDWRQVTKLKKYLFRFITRTYKSKTNRSSYFFFTCSNYYWKISF